MQINADEAARLADMLRLSLSGEEAARFAGDMSSVLGYMSVLDRLDLEGVDPMGVSGNEFAGLRDDAPVPSLARADLMAMGGAAFVPAEDAFVVQAVFEEQ